MKTVFSNDMCAHVWAQLKQPNGRSDNMSFDGAVAYSYAQPVAHLMKKRDGGIIALYTSRKWSNTTARHVSLYRRAAQQYPDFTVPEIHRHRFHCADVSESEHKQNFRYFEDEYNQTRDRLLRVPATSYMLETNESQLHGHLIDAPRNPTRAHDALYRIAHACIEYCAAFELPAPEWTINSRWTADADAAINRRDRLLNDPKRAAKIAARERQRAAKEERDRLAAEQRRIARLAELSETVKEWRAGIINHIPYDGQRCADGSAMLRISKDGTRVETSMGAEAPLEHVRRALVLYATCSRPWQRGQDSDDSHYTKLGHFTMDRIDAQGNVRAGCHFITAREIEELRAKLEYEFDENGNRA